MSVLYVEANTMARAQGRPDLPQGTLDLLILTVLGGGPQHGYAVMRRLQLLSRDAIQIRHGSLYPALHRLEKRGLLSTSWGPSDTGRDAKFYSLTAQGRAELEHELASWEQLTRAVRLVLRSAEGGAL